MTRPEYASKRRVPDQKEDCVSRVPPTGRSRWRLVAALVLSCLLLAAACGDDSGDDGGSASGGGGDDGGGEVVPLRLGYFPNVTHAPAVAGVQEGLFDDALEGT